MGRRFGFARSRPRRSSIFSPISRRGRATNPPSTNFRLARKLVNLRDLRSTGPDILLVDWLSHHPLFSPPSPPSSSPRSLPIEPLNLNSKEPLSASYLEEIGRFSPPLDLPLPLAYAPNLVNLASKISEPIHPFLSIHWRTERIPATRLLSCSRRLLNKLEDVLATSRGSGIRTVYLATGELLDVFCNLGGLL